MRLFNTPEALQERVTEIQHLEAGDLVVRSGWSWGGCIPGLATTSLDPERPRQPKPTEELLFAGRSAAARR